MATPIAHSIDNKTASRFDPFPTYKFHVEIGDITEAAFMECSGLQMSTEVFTYAEGGLNEYVHQFPGRTKYSNITLKRGFATSNEIYDWYKQMETNLLGGKPVEFRQVTIILYSGVVQDKSMRWILNKAFPVKWAGPSFKTEEASFAVETLEFAHHGIQTDLANA